MHNVMDNIQSLILDTYKSKPKHFTRILKKDQKVLDYISEHVPGDITEFMNQLYYAVYRESNICQFGNIKKLKSFNGYSGCGKAGICQCIKDKVSLSVSKSKKNTAPEKIKESNQQRVETNLKKYGTGNTGQTDKAKTARKLFYASADKVASTVERSKHTKLRKYGNENFNNSAKTKQTVLEKYGVSNIVQLSEKYNKPGLELVRDKDSLTNLFSKHSIDEISNITGASPTTLYQYLETFGLRTRYQSSYEVEIINFLKSHGVGNIVTNTRKLIPNREIDIFLPEYNLAIEFNGVYWHHSNVPGIDKNYHYNKFKECERIGVELFSIFSDSWDQHKQAWKEKILSKIGKLDKRVFARKCQVIRISSSETKDLLTNHHIQGYCTSEIAYALKHNDEIVAVMTFSKPRPGIGKVYREGAYELVRYATKYSVPGGASRLLKRFVKDVCPTLIVSYSSNVYSTGKLYRTLGFSLSRENTSGYWYYHSKTKKSYHRSSFTKHKLVNDGNDPTLSESEIMKNLGYLKLWDCGTRLWMLEVSSGIDC